jgi:hypothetical protein
MEEIDDLTPPKPAEFTEDSQTASLWSQGATGAVALTLLASCGIAINIHNPIDALGNLLFTVPVTFFIAWGICTFLLWVYGKLVPLLEAWTK